ncbi:MAG: hypothetical protein J7604_08170 [Sporocytophaga sp.]|uniref:hypothetical protein n=1 Tax=Sporocytophaga sp. TaxID=2231183 RepID=UPI001AFE358A|nr:hypothetical protein [Sporocytophaga sp.]MBO9700174.1 hypothetical protein [Sporocytophaga sp.]
MENPEYFDGPDGEELGDIEDPKFGRKRQNLEMLPIQELRKRAELRKIKDFETLNKQKLIEALHKYEESNQK